MFRTGICLAAALIVINTLVASAQTSSAPATAATPAPSRMKLTQERLKEMRLKWNQNKTKLAACRKVVKSKGLIGDDRWFFIGDCMDKS